jgi:general secretion pathway protein K
MARKRQNGAALLIAMLTVTLIATFAAAALWQQWRSAEIEGAERARVQSGWILTGALDWSRLILREDGRASAGVDSLAEPWAVPLAEAKLSSFIAADKNISSDQLEGLPDAFLSGRIIDAQSKLNVRNLVQGGKADAAAVAAFRKLFQLLGLPVDEVDTLVAQLALVQPPAVAATTTATTTTATTTTTAAESADGSVTGGTATAASSASSGAGSGAESGAGSGPLMPWRTDQLVWLGLSPSTAAALEPYVTIMPAVTVLNLNTASAEAIFASVPKLDLASARRLVERRAQGYFGDLAAANALMQDSTVQFVAGQHGVATAYFEVHARLRLDTTWVEERALLHRAGAVVQIVWRERGAGLSGLSPVPGPS